MKIIQSIVLPNTVDINLILILVDQPKTGRPKHVLGLSSKLNKICCI